MINVGKLDLPSMIEDAKTEPWFEFNHAYFDCLEKATEKQIPFILIIEKKDDNIHWEIYLSIDTACILVSDIYTSFDLYEDMGSNCEVARQMAASTPLQRLKLAYDVLKSTGDSAAVNRALDAATREDEANGNQQ